MRFMGGALKIRFIEIHHGRGRTGNGYGSGLKNFVIQGDGQFRLAQTGADEQSKFAGDAARLGDGFAPDGIYDRLVGQSNVLDDEAAMKPEVFELPDVNHGEIQTPIAPIVHSKMNTGKEPFKCGMESAECGVRPNLISVIAQPRAPRPVK